MSVNPFKLSSIFLIFMFKGFFPQECYISPLHENSDRLCKSTEMKLKNTESPIIKKSCRFN